MKRHITIFFGSLAIAAVLMCYGVDAGDHPSAGKPASEHAGTVESEDAEAKSSEHPSSDHPTTEGTEDLEAEAHEHPGAEHPY